jgi:hypothetical protein
MQVRLQLRLCNVGEIAMKRFDPRIVFGFLLVVGGGIALAQTMGLLVNTSNVLWGGLVFAAGLVFLSLLLGGYWWGAFPGFTLATLGALILFPGTFGFFGGALFLGGIGISFWYVYFTSRVERWWALIPAGVLTTLAGVTIAVERLGEFQTAGFFFFGLAMTFLLVALLADMRWAYWPALILGIMGFFGIASLLNIANYFWAVILIGAGAFMLFRYFTHR